MTNRRFDRRRLGITRRPAQDRILVRFRLLLALLVAVTVYGVVGYRVLEGWSLLDALYMTVITLATVGFHEVHPLGVRGRRSRSRSSSLGCWRCWWRLGSSPSWWHPGSSPGS